MAGVNNFSHTLIYLANTISVKNLLYISKYGDILKTMKDMNAINYTKEDMPHWIRSKYDNARCSRCSKAIPIGTKCIFIPKDNKLLCSNYRCGILFLTRAKQMLMEIINEKL